MPVHLCWAGRLAFHGGKWSRDHPCPNISLHLIAAPVGPGIHLCQRHFDEVNEAGLVHEPFLDPDEFKRRRPDIWNAEGST